MAKLSQEEKDRRNAKRKATLEAKKKAEEERIKQHLIESSIEDAMRGGRRSGKPTRFFEPGEEVRIGNLSKCVVKEVLEDGIAYLMKVTHKSSKKNQAVLEEEEKERAWPWYEIYKKVNLDDYPEPIHKKKQYFINFRQTTIEELVRTTNYTFGIKKDPEYQRDLVWSEEDKVALIDSIFKDVEIGKFVLIHLGYGKEYSYEVLDGKQRLSALCDFFEGRFKYKGLTFDEMHPQDRNHFRDFPISVGETRDIITRKQKLEYFLRLNTRGRDQTADHMDKIMDMLEEEKEKEKK